MEGDRKLLVSIVIPCYNSSHTIKKVVSLTLQEFDKLPDYECEFVLVNDFSKDNTFETIRELCQTYSFVKGIDLSRNFGQHNAIIAGLHYASGEYIIGMDDDLQTHPSQIPKLLSKLEEGHDLVFGIFPQTKFKWFKRFTSKAASFLMWHMISRPKGIEASNYWICKKYVRDELIKYQNYNLYLQVLFYQTSHHIANVELEHFERDSGTSNYTFRKLFSLFLTCLNYTVIPLRISTFLGVLFALGGFTGSVVIVVRKLLDPSITVGWSSMMCAMFVFFGIVLLLLGIMGEYIGKMILSMNRMPQYVVREQINTEPECGQTLSGRDTGTN